MNKLDELIDQLRSQIIQGKEPYKTVYVALAMLEEKRDSLNKEKGEQIMEKYEDIDDYGWLTKEEDVKNV